MQMKVGISHSYYYCTINIISVWLKKKAPMTKKVGSKSFLLIIIIRLVFDPAVSSPKLGR